MMNIINIIIALLIEVLIQLIGKIAKNDEGNLAFSSNKIEM